MLTCRQNEMHLRTSTTATSWGVVTTTAPSGHAELTDGQRLVARPGRRIDEEIIEFAPLHVAEELLMTPILSGPRQTMGIPGSRPQRRCMPP